MNADITSVKSSPVRGISTYSTAAASAQSTVDSVNCSSAVPGGGMGMRKRPNPTGRRRKSDAAKYATAAASITAPPPWTTVGPASVSRSGCGSNASA
jgi:hypothetical protein